MAMWLNHHAAQSMPTGEVAAHTFAGSRGSGFRACERVVYIARRCSLFLPYNKQKCTRKDGQ